MKTTYLKIYSLLTLSERRGVIVLLALMVVGMLLETLGIGLIIPVISLMMQEDLLINYPSFASILNFWGNPSQTELITTIMIGLVGVYLIKNVLKQS